MTALWLSLMALGIVLIAAALWPTLRRNHPKPPTD